MHAILLHQGVNIWLILLSVLQAHLMLLSALLVWRLSIVRVMYIKPISPVPQFGMVTAAQGAQCGPSPRTVDLLTHGSSLFSVGAPAVPQASISDPAPLPCSTSSLSHGVLHSLQAQSICKWG